MKEITNGSQQWTIRQNPPEFVMMVNDLHEPTMESFATFIRRVVSNEHKIKFPEKYGVNGRLLPGLASRINDNSNNKEIIKNGKSTCKNPRKKIQRKFEQRVSA